MNKKIILFDLDGTLLPMDQDKFINTYFSLLAKKLFNYGYEPKKLVDSVYKGTMVMISNDGSKTNEQAFWGFFKTIYGDDVIKDHNKFEEFYKNEFQLVKNVCGFNKDANELIKYLKKENYRIILATNPIFPSIATQSRIKWAGLDIDDFELVTTYENSKYCKPNLNYYLEILDKINVKAEDCLMVGNDVCEDMITRKLGMDVFLVTNDLINKSNEDIINYPNGNLSDLKLYIKKNSEQ